MGLEENVVLHFPTAVGVGRLERKGFNIPIGGSEWTWVLPARVLGLLNQQELIRGLTRN